MADQLIVLLAEQLRAQLRRGDSLMRIGGDELAVIIERVDDSMDVTRTSASCSWIPCREPLVVAGHSLLVTVSMGVAMYPEAGDYAGDPAAPG